MVEHLNEKDFAEKVENSNNKSLVDFYADWCGPCKMMAPVVEELSDEISGVAFYKVNVDECPDIAKKYGIMSIPTFIVFEDGQPVNKQLGAMPKDTLEQLLK